jgi:hypothetical protein
MKNFTLLKPNKISAKTMMYALLFLVSSTSAVIIPSQAEVEAAQCFQGNDYSIQNTLSNTVNNYMNTNTKVCGNNVRIKRVFRIHPYNIDQLLAVKAFDDIKTRQIEQICYNLLNVSERDVLNNAQNMTTIDQKLKCRFTFKETNMFKVSRGDSEYLKKVAQFFNKFANFNVTIVGGSDLNIESSVIADNNSTSTVDLQLKTTLVSRTKQKNVIKLWHRASDETTDYLRSLLNPTSVIDVKCNDTTNANQTQVSTNSSTSNNNVVNNLTCDVQASQTNNVR